MKKMRTMRTGGRMAKFLALLVACSLVLGSSSTIVFAEENEPEAQTENTAKDLMIAGTEDSESSGPSDVVKTAGAANPADAASTPGTDDAPTTDLDDLQKPLETEGQGKPEGCTCEFAEGKHTEDCPAYISEEETADADEPDQVQPQDGGKLKAKAAAATVATEEELLAAVESADAEIVIQVAGEVALSQTMTIEKGKKIVLQGGAILRGEKLPLGDPMIMIKGELTLSEEGTALKGLGAEKIVGAPLVKVDGGAFSMKGGVIEDNFRKASTGYGGAVGIASGTFHLSGGVIRNCGSDNGGGVGVYGGSFQMTGGAVENCKSDRGPAVCVRQGAKFEQTGGTLNRDEVLAEAGTAKLAVAKIGETPYFSLAEAVEAAEAGDVVALAADVTESMVVGDGKDMVLDLNGKTLTNTDGEHTIVVRAGAKLTIQDGAGNGVVDNVSHGKAALYNEGTIVEISGGTFKRSTEDGKTWENSKDVNNSYYTAVNKGRIQRITGGVFENAGTYSSSFINSGEIDNIAGGMFKGGKIALKNDPTGVINSIENATIQGSSLLRNGSTPYIFIGLLNYHVIGKITNTKIVSSGEGINNNSDGGEAVVELGDGVTVQSKNSYPAILASGERSTVTIRNGSYEAVNLYSGYPAVDARNQANIAISGGKFSSNVAAYCTRGLTTQAVEVNTKKYYEIVVDQELAAAKIGDQYFLALEEALAAANAGDVIELVADQVTAREAMPVSKNVTLDLKGKNLKLENAAQFLIEDGGSLTVVGAGNVTAARDSSKFTNDLNSEQISIFKVASNGKLQMEDGNFTTNAYWIVNCAGAAEIKDGTFHCTDYCQAKSILVVSGADAKLTVEDGVYTAATGGTNLYPNSYSATEDKEGKQGYDGLYGIDVKNGATLILGKEGSSDGPEITTVYAPVAMNNLTASGTLKIHGGTYTSTVSLKDEGKHWEKFNTALYLSADADVTITGGTFIAAQGEHADADSQTYVISIPYEKANVKLNISGGTFHSTGEAIYMPGYPSKEGTGSPTVAISGGAFSSDVTEHCVDGYHAARSGSMYIVQARQPVTPTQPGATTGGTTTGGGGGTSGGGTTTTLLTTTPPAVPVAPAPAQPAAPAAVTPQVPEETTQLEEDETPLAAPEAPEETPAGSEEVLDLEEDDVPLAADNGSWALLNLILMLATAAAAILMVIGAVRKENAETEEVSGRSIRMISLIPAACSLVVFLLTEKLAGTMVFVDRWTIAMLLIALIQGFVVYFVVKNSEDTQIRA